MQPTLVLLVAVAALLAAIAGLSWRWNSHGVGKHRREHEERRKAEREASAKVRGWRYNGLIEGDIHYRMNSHTPDGIGWSLHYDSDHGSSASRPKLVFQAKALRTPAYEWILHDKKTFDLTQKAAVKAIVGGVARIVGAFSQSMKLKRAFYMQAQPLAVGGTAFRKRYVLAAADPRWSQLVDHDVERLILHFPFFVGTMSDVDNCFSASLSPEGLEIQLYCDAPDFAVIAHLARLGEALATNTLSLMPRESSDTAAATAG